MISFWVTSDKQYLVYLSKYTLVLKSLLINYDLLDLVLVFNEGDKHTCEELRNGIAIAYSSCSSAEFYGILVYTFGNIAG